MMVSKLKRKNVVFEADEVVISSSFVQSKLNYCLKDEKIISPLWSKNSINFHQKNNFKIDDKICIIGTGLSAVDVLLGLDAKNFSGKIYAISRRGNFPQPHFSQQNIISNQESINVIENSDVNSGLVNILLKFRNYLKNNENYDLRHLIDSIRGKTTFLWQNFDEKSKKNFLKKLLPYWNIFRHRVPNSSLEIINKMIKNNRLEIIKSSVKSIEKSDGKFIIKTKLKTLEKISSFSNISFSFILILSCLNLCCEAQI